MDVNFPPKTLMFIWFEVVLFVAYMAIPTAVAPVPQDKVSSSTPRS